MATVKKNNDFESDDDDDDDDDDGSGDWGSMTLLDLLRMSGPRN